MTDVNDLSKYQLCKLSGKPKKIIDDWIALGCPHRKVDGRYSFSFAEVFAWREKYLTEKAEREEQSEIDIALEEQRLRISQARAEKLEWENARRRAELADPREMGTVWKKAVAEMSEKALALPPALAPKLAEEPRATVCQAIMNDAVYDLLNELSGVGSDNV